MQSQQQSQPQIPSRSTVNLTQQTRPFPNQYTNICFISPINSTSSPTPSLPVKILKLKQNLTSNIESSFNPILTLASFIVFSFPKLKPPKFESLEETNGMIDEIYPNEALSVNGLLEPWCDYISSLVMEDGKVFNSGSEGGEIYFLDVVEMEYLEQKAIKGEEGEGSLGKDKSFEIVQMEIEIGDCSDKGSALQKKPQLYNRILRKVFKLNSPTSDTQPLNSTSRRKYAIVSFSASVAQKDPYHPRIHMRALIFGLFYRNGDIWKSYYILRDQIPSPQQIQTLDGIILSGSSNSVNDEIPQVDKFMKNLVEAYKRTESSDNDSAEQAAKKFKVLGLCFGHQAMAKYLGGKVIKIPKRIIGLERIRLDWEKIQEMNLGFFFKPKQKSEQNEQSSTFSNTSRPQVKPQYLVSQFHGDSVSEIPQDFQIIGHSDTCLNQVQISKNKRILSFQFHMEYTPEYAKSYEVRLKVYRPDYEHGKIFAGASEVLSCKENVESILDLREISRRFLDGNNEQ